MSTLGIELDFKASLEAVSPNVKKLLDYLEVASSPQYTLPVPGTEPEAILYRSDSTRATDPKTSPIPMLPIDPLKIPVKPLPGLPCRPRAASDMGEILLWLLKEFVGPVVKELDTLKKQYETHTHLTAATGPPSLPSTLTPV